MTYDPFELSSLKRHWLLRTSNIPQRFIGYEPEDIIKDTGSFPQEIEDWLGKALNGDIIKKIGGLNTTGVGLLFDGLPGLGKTTHAVTSAMELIRRLPEKTEDMANILKMSPETFGMNSRPIYYMTYPEFLSRKKAIFDAEYDVKQKMIAEMDGFHGRAEDDRLNVRVLVLDDLGKEYNSQYNDSSFDEILRARYDKALPTIITTNVHLENWNTQYSEAMASFAHEAFSLVRIMGKDLRK